jgi:hypothetical protein
MQIKSMALAGVLGLLGLGAGSVAANAAIVLNFAGLNGSAGEHILNYYNGGLGGDGSGPGPNFGITFGPDAIACNGAPGGSCNTAMIPGGAGAQIAFFLTGPGDVMDRAAGFTAGFSFFYSAAFDSGSVEVFSGLDGTGTLLATLALPVTTNGASVPGCLGRNFCPFVAAGITFSGTAESVDFTGTANQIAFADITLGSATPGGTVPEPSTWAMMLVGFAGLGFLGYRASHKRGAFAV